LNSWFVDLFKGDIINDLKQQAGSDIETTITTVYQPEWNTFLEQITTTFDVYGRIGIDFSLTDAPTFVESSYLSFPLKGIS
jgi:hypothetical protein